MRKSYLIGSLTLAAYASVSGFTSIIASDLALPAPVGVFFRMFFAVACLIVIAAIWQRKALRFTAWPVYGVGALLALHFGLYFASLQTTSTTSAILVSYMSPVFMAALAPVLLKEKVGIGTVAALVLSITGAVIITLSSSSGGKDVTVVGVLLALGAGLTMALMIMATKKAAANVEPIRFILHQSIAAMVFFAPVAIIGGLMGHFVLDGRALLQTATLGVIFSGIGGMVFIWSLKRVSATSVGILSFLEPVATAILAAVLLGEALTWKISLGGTLILAAGLIVVLAGSRSAESAESGETSDSVPEYQPMDLSSPLVGENGLEVVHVTDNGILEGDAISAKYGAGLTRNGNGSIDVVELPEADVLR